MEKSRLWGVTVLVVFLFAGIALAQVTTGTIVGLVRDASGAVLAGAQVQIQNVDTGLSRSETTDAQGRYLARDLPLGSYSVTVQQAGFQTAERRGITLSVGSEVTVNVELAIGNVQEKVEVTAEAPAVETTNAQVSVLVDGGQIRELPLNGRSMQDLALLTPGLMASRDVTTSASLGLGARLSINGSRVDSILYLLDGTVVNDASGGGPVSATSNILGVESILEFRFLTHNFSAEYGRVSAGVMSQVTRSGTNVFHGSAYEFLRNNIFDARNVFNPGSLPAFRQNQFGGSMGGPVKKDRIFFFFNYEGLQQRQGVTENFGVPDANARKGLLPCAAAPTAPCNAATNLATVPFNPAVVPFLSLFPQPNGVSYGDGTAQYRGTNHNTAGENYYMSRMDFRLSDKDNFFWRWVYNPSNSSVPKPIPDWGLVTQYLANYTAMSETHVFSGASVNEFRVAYNRTDPVVTIPTLVPLDPSLTILPGEPLARIQFTVQNGTGGQLPELGGTVAQAGAIAQNTFEESDTFSTVRGAHSLKFGVGVERVQINSFENYATVNGTEPFGGLAAFLAGTPSSITFALPSPGNHFDRGFRRNIVGLFVQDDYRIRPNLTLNLGLREDVFTTPTEVNGYIGALINLSDAAMTPGPAFISPWKTFSPRLGIAWDPFGDGKTSVRIGAGIYYNPLDGRAYYNSSRGGPLFQSSFQLSNPPFPNPLVNGVTALVPTTTVLPYHPANPTTNNYNFEVQRQLTPSLSLRARYIGSTSYHMPRAVQVDTRIPTTVNGVVTYPASGPLINPHFSNILLTATDARANYNGLQTTLEKRLSAGLQFQATYTWSKAMSNSDQSIAATSNLTPNNTMNPNNLAADYGLSVYDQRHAFLMNVVYQLPTVPAFKSGFGKALLAGWAINGIYTFNTGNAFTAGDGFNNSRDGDSTNPDRPNLNPGFSPDPINGSTAGCPGIAAGQALQTTQLWYNPCAFSLSPAGTFGNLGRTTLTAPGLNNVNFGFGKNTSITERIKLQFRWELFNLFNHPYYNIPNLLVFTSARAYNGSAGTITSTLQPNRQMQFGLKLTF